MMLEGYWFMVKCKYAIISSFITVTEEAVLKKYIFFFKLKSQIFYTQK